MRRAGHLAALAGILCLATGGAAASTDGPLWGNPTLLGSEATTDQIGWSAQGRRGFLWRRDPPIEQPQAVAWKQGRRHPYRPGWRPRRAQARLWRQERPLASVSFDPGCPARGRTRLTLIKIPLAEPSMLEDAPVGLRLTYHLEQRWGWVDAQITTTANEVTSVEMPGGHEGPGEMHLWLDADTVREARGISAAVRLIVHTRGCGHAVFSLDSVEIEQG